MGRNCNLTKMQWGSQHSWDWAEGWAESCWFESIWPFFITSQLLANSWHSAGQSKQRVKLARAFTNFSFHPILLWMLSRILRRSLGCPMGIIYYLCNLYKYFSVSEGIYFQYCSETLLRLFVSLPKLVETLLRLCWDSAESFWDSIEFSWKLRLVETLLRIAESFLKLAETLLRPNRYKLRI